MTGTVGVVIAAVEFRGTWCWPCPCVVTCMCGGEADDELSLLYMFSITPVYTKAHTGILIYYNALMP